MLPMIKTKYENNVTHVKLFTKIMLPMIKQNYENNVTRVQFCTNIILPMFTFVRKECCQCSIL